jgi:hypothetical protein
MQACANFYDDLVLFQSLQTNHQHRRRLKVAGLKNQIAVPASSG